MPPQLRLNSKNPDAELPQTVLLMSGDALQNMPPARRDALLQGLGSTAADILGDGVAIKIGYDMAPSGAAAELGPSMRGVRVHASQTNQRDFATVTDTAQSHISAVESGRGYSWFSVYIACRRSNGVCRPDYIYRIYGG